MPFLIADRFPGVSPADVGEWDAVLVDRALARIQVEGAVAQERREAAGHDARRRAQGAESLEGLPELE